ncbi:MAG: hypothetical protein GXP22_04385 [Gammaproteobacteria bacterium]|nr:hypothetical protein [Gammaproteobacteria bacterium]
MITGVGSSTNTFYKSGVTPALSNDNKPADSQTSNKDIQASADKKTNEASVKTDQKNQPTSKSIEQELSQSELRQVQTLQSRDREVRNHEQAHLSAAGTLAQGGASFSYSVGPNGKRYATGGEVSIDTGKINGDPKATINKAEQIQRAALAPATPSQQDRRVAARAISMAQEARVELTTNPPTETQGNKRIEKEADPATEKPQVSNSRQQNLKLMEDVQRNYQVTAGTSLYA